MVLVPSLSEPISNSTEATPLPLAEKVTAPLTVWFAMGVIIETEAALAFAEATLAASSSHKQKVDFLLTS